MIQKAILNAKVETALLRYRVNACSMIKSFESLFSHFERDR